MVLDLRTAIDRAQAIYKAMSPEQQTEMWRAQRESWVRAFTTPCEHGSLDWESCEDCRALSREGVKP